MRTRRLVASGCVAGAAKLNDVDPQAWLADVLARINDLSVHQPGELLPWNRKSP